MAASAEYRAALKARRVQYRGAVITEMERIFGDGAKDGILGHATVRATDTLDWRALQAFATILANCDRRPA